MNEDSSILGITPLANAAKVLGSSRRELLQMAADGKLVIREINGKFFVEVDSIQKMIQSAPIVKFDDGRDRKEAQPGDGMKAFNDQMTKAKANLF
jgi:hypothetical protein